jgi:hypothetical protein
MVEEEMGEEENGEEETDFGYGENIYIFFFKKPHQIFGKPRDDPWLPKITIIYIYIRYVFNEKHAPYFRKLIILILENLLCSDHACRSDQNSQLTFRKHSITIIN